MKKALKKWIIRFIIIELIANIAFFSTTAYLFGSIKPFKPLIKKSRIVTKSGILYKKGIDAYMQGSYVLKEKGKKVLVETKRNLNKYLGKKVYIKGTVKKSVEGAAQGIDGDGSTTDKRLEVITLRSISTKAPNK